MITPTRRAPAFFRTTALVALACYLPACTAWHRQSAPPQQVLTTKQPSKLRVVRQDGSKVEILQPRIEGDSLVGTAAQAPPGAPAPRVAIALVDIGAVEVHEGDIGRTLILIGVVGVAILAVAAIAASSTSYFNTGPDTMHSSPHVYAWNGEAWQLESGTYAGAIARGVAATDVTLMPHAVAQDGALDLQIRNELNETDYLDAIAVLAVDHAPGVEVAPGPDGTLHGIGALTGATRAREDAGRDVMALLAVADGRSWESRLAGRDTSDPRSLSDGVELVFTRPADARTARLVVDARNTSWAPFMLGWIVSMHGRATGAWYDSLASDPAAARRYREFLSREGALRVLLREGDRWVPQGMVTDPGPEVTRRQVVPLDLAGQDGPTVRVRLESAPSLWMIDHVAADFGAEPALVVHDLAPARARMADGHDVISLISHADGREWEFDQGATADVSFPLPPATRGMGRSYLVRTTGWYRIHLAEVGAPDVARLDQVFNEPRGAARVSLAALNRAIQRASDTGTAR